MPARCHNDSCSIKWREVTTMSGPAYEAHVDIDSGDVFSASSGLPTIVCGANGLEVAVSPDGGNTLAKRNNGLFVDQVGAQHTAIANKPYLGIPATAVSGTDDRISTADHVAANPLGVPAVAVVTGTLEWFYTVTELAPPNGDSGDTQGLAGNYFAYNAQMQGRLFVDNDGTFAVADKSLWLDISGVVEANPSQDKGSHQDFTLIQDVPAGDDLHLKADACYVATSAAVNQRRNVSFDVSQSNPARGFRLANIDIVWIPAG